MTEHPNYYQWIPGELALKSPERFPKNHVNYSALLTPVKVISNIYRLVGKQAFATKDAILKEYDSAAPLDRYLGTPEEIGQVRMLVESMCEGLDNNSFLSPIGRYITKKTTLGMLQNRRKVLHYYEANKSFIEQHGRFKAPLIITGASRTGTTLLQRLLSEDPNTRSPYTFELEKPIPPLKQGTDPLRDPRIVSSRTGIKKLLKIAPGFVEKFAESHVWSATEMEESMIYLYAHNGLMVMNIPLCGREHIKDVMRIKDLQAIFRYEKLFFTMLDAYSPVKSHWTLKAPIYATALPLVFEEYEDARVVLTHRNPIITLPSLCRLFESWCIAFDEDGTFDKHRFGKMIRLLHKLYHEVPLAYRRSHPEHEGRIFDCMYDAFFADPIKTVRKIYDKFDLEYTREFEDRMKVYLEHNRQGKYGRHKYSLEEYGLNAEELFEEHKDYMDHYGYKIPPKFQRPASFDFLKNYKKGT